MTLLYAREGTEFLVNSTTANQQIKPKTVALTGGGFVIVWQDASGVGGDPSISAIKAQRYDSGGQPVGAEFLVNTSTNNGQVDPSVTATANGGFFVAWADFSGSGGDFDWSVKGQFFDPAGAKSGGELLLNTITAGTQSRPSVATLADGAVAVTWAGPSGNNSLPVTYHTQVFEANGTKRGAETSVVDTAGGGTVIPATLVGLAGGGYVVSWSSNTLVYARIFDSSGNPTGATFKLSEYTSGIEQAQSLVATSDGGFVAAWASWAGQDRNDVVARRFSATGEPLGASFTVTETTAGHQFMPDIAAIPGGYIITWQAGLGDYGQTWDIKGQIYDSNFNRSGNEFFVNSDRPGHQTDSQLTVLADGKIVVTWQGVDGPQNSGGVKAQLLRASPTPTDISLSTNSVVETAVENMPFATVSSDGGINADLTYTYLGDSLGGAFRLEGTTLVVADNGRLDAESQGSVSVSLRVTNDDGQSYDEIIALQVADSNYEARYNAGPVTNATDATSETADLASGGFLQLRYDAYISSAMAADIYDASGNFVNSVTIPSPGYRVGGKAAGLANGNFVVTWGIEPSGEGIQAQLFDAAGNVISGVIPVNTVTKDEQFNPGVGALAGGGFVIAWSDSSEFDTDVELVAQIFDSAGNKVGAQFMVNDEDYQFRQGNARVVGLTNGGFVVTWGESSTSIKAQVYDAVGNRVGGNVLVNTTDLNDQYNHRVTALEGGGFAVVWEDASQAVYAVGGWDSRAQAFDALGNKVGGEILVSANPVGSQINANIHSMPDGGFVIVWQDQPPRLDTDQLAPNPSTVRAQFFDAAGNRLGPIFDVAGDGISQYMPAVAVTDQGDVFVSWNNGARRLLALEQPVAANNDSAAAQENAVLQGNVLANDYHEPNAVLRVGAVNGQASAVGQTIALPSGATLLVGSDGNYAYNPNGAFDYLVGAAGAANHSATDSFTYMLTNGTTATATITVTGVGRLGDRPAGTAGNDAILGTSASEYFDLDQGGVDNVQGNAGNDAFYFGGTLTSADVANGGADLDTLILQGDYSGGVTIGSGVTNIEALSLFGGGNTSFGDPGTNLYSYVVTTSDSNFAAGLQVKVNASPLLAGENFTFDGSAEMDAKFLIYGGRGVDTLTGGMGHDTFFFADDGRLAPGDTIDGGPGGYDGLFLRGNYVIDFSAPGYSNLMTSIENVTVTSITDERYARGGGTEFDYDIKFGDAQVAAGGVLTVNGGLLQANETLVVDGGLETNGSFRIFGGASADTLKGGAGGDLIEGGLGADMLGGGGGNDVFSYKSVLQSTVAGSDQILDFAAGDRIDLSAIDADSSAAGNNAFAWIGGDAFSGQAGQLRGTAVGNVWTIQGDTDGNGIADFQILVTVADSHTIAAGDFVL